MITKLTISQISQLKAYVEKWQNMQILTQSADRYATEYSVWVAYANAGLPPPQKIVWLQSPYEMLESIKKVLSNDPKLFKKLAGKNVTSKIERSIFQEFNDVMQTSLDSKIHNVLKMIFRLVTRDSTYLTTVDHIDRSLERTFRRYIRQSGKRVYIPFPSNTQRLYQPLYWHYARHELGLLEETKNLANLHAIPKNVDYWLSFENICFLSEQPEYISLDEHGRLHSENRAALSYADGWEIYVWHGVLVPEYVIMYPEDITPNRIIEERNREVARIMLERYGQDNFIRNGGFTIQQSDDYGDLYRIEFKNHRDEPIVAVHVKDPSTDREYFLYVPPHIRTAHEGVAWTFGYDNPSDYNPLKET